MKTKLPVHHSSSPEPEMIEVKPEIVIDNASSDSDKGNVNSYLAFQNYYHFNESAK